MIARLVNFKFTPEDDARLRAIRDKTYAPTNSAAMRTALKVACATLGLKVEAGDSSAG